MGETYKILIVDDETRNQRIIEEVLEGAYDAKVADSGEQAIEIMETFLPDLILLDVMMPGIDGYEVCRRVRGNSKLNHTKVILVTGRAMIDERLKGYECGADDYLCKPFVPEELLAKIKVFLRLVKVERDLTLLNKELDARVAERTNKLLTIEAKLQTASKMSALGEMAGGIAHEVNTPLATILLLAEQTQEDLRDGIVEPLALGENLKAIESAAQHISKIIRGMRMFSRNGTSDPFTPYALSEVMRETLLLCGERLRQENVRVELTGDASTIECRPSQIAQILMNLLNNARDAMHDISEKWVKVEMKDLGDNVEVSITNGGEKIPQEVAERIFQPFFTTKEVGRGTGLGLSISRGIAETHGGDLELTEDGGHTCFKLTLPKRQPLKAAG